MRVYACADGGSYDEKVTATPDGVAVLGGFHCADWTYDTTLRAKVASPATIAWKIDKATTGIVISDVEVVAPDATAKGDSRIAMLVSGSQNVLLRRVKLTAGVGAPGADGASFNDKAADGGATGNDGAVACTLASSANDNPGAAEAETKC